MGTMPLSNPQDELAAFIARVNPGVQLTAVQMDTVIEEVREHGDEQKGRMTSLQKKKHC